MMLEKFEVVTEPKVEPVDILLIKKYLRLSGNAMDDIILMIMKACRYELEDQLGRCFSTQTVMATLTLEQPLTSKIAGVVDIDHIPGVKLPRVPVQKISKVELEVEPETFQVLPTENYAITLAEPTIVTLYASAYAPFNYPWWLEYQVYPRIRVTYDVGYAENYPDWMALLFYQLVAERYAESEGTHISRSLESSIVARRTPRV